MVSRHVACRHQGEAVGRVLMFHERDTNECRNILRRGMEAYEEHFISWRVGRLLAAL